MSDKERVEIDLPETILLRNLGESSTKIYMLGKFPNQGYKGTRKTPNLEKNMNFWSLHSILAPTDFCFGKRSITQQLRCFLRNCALWRRSKKTVLRISETILKYWFRSSQAFTVAIAEWELLKSSPARKTTFLYGRSNNFDLMEICGRLDPCNRNFGNHKALCRDRSDHMHDQV